MLTGIYDYIFGGEDSNQSTSSTEEFPEIHGKSCDNGWFLIENQNNSGRFSPVLVPNPELRDIDELSYASRKSTGKSSKRPLAATAEELFRKAEEVRLVKERIAQRAYLEKMLFDDCTTTSTTNSIYKKNSSGIKRVTAQVNDLHKGKSRSKKASGKLSSGRNNDRKVNNID